MPLEDYYSNSNPHPDWTIEQIWDDIGSFTYEKMYSSKDKSGAVNFRVVIPPLLYKGTFTKGIYFSQCTRMLQKRYPDLEKLFLSCACSMWCSYPKCDTADAYICCYENKKHEAYHKSKYPNKKDIVFLPVQEADWTDEYIMAPVLGQKKTIDVLMVVSPFNFKNTVIFANMLKIYEKKYGRKLKTVWIMGNKEIIKQQDGSIDYSCAHKNAVEQMNRVFKALGGHPEEYIEFLPHIKHANLPKFYSSAKCCVLPSLIEGKNRFISESMSCNTPIVVFRDFNKYTRGNYPVFFGNSGEYVEEYSPECMADTVHKVISNYQFYEPRKNYLKHSGRKNVADLMASSIPYFRNNIPNFYDSAFHDNVFVDLACQLNYGLSYNDFLYDKNIKISSQKGIDNIREMLKFYYSKFSLEWNEVDYWE